MTKKIMLGVCTILLILSVMKVSAAAGRDVNSPFPIVTLVNQEPNPVEPGEVVTLRFQIQNNGTATNNEVKAELIHGFPFSIYSDRIVTIGSLRAGQTGLESVIVEFEIRIDENAVEQNELVDLRLTFDGNNRLYRDFPVSVKTRDAILAVRSIATVPEIVEPGDDFQLKLGLVNSADSLLRNVNVKLNISSAPFVPTQSTAEEYIYQLNSNTQKFVVFDVTALPEATGGLYKIPITFSYTDETGTSTEKEDFIGLKISSLPDLLVTIDSSEITNKQRRGDISIKIVNRGLTDLKLATATVKEGDKYSLLSGKDVYVGNIDTDDFETAEYTIALRTFDKIIDIPLTLHYRDITNKQFSETVVVSLRTQSNGLILTIIGGIFKLLLWGGILAGLGYGGYKFYKRRKKRRKG
jgi:hypothetical protein